MINKKKTFITILISLLLIIPINMISCSGESWLDGFSYRKKITITEVSGSNLINYHIPIKTYYGSGTDGAETENSDIMIKIYLNSHAQIDFDDIRFTNSTGNSELDYWCQEYTSSTSAIFWVEFDLITASDDTDFYIYYGNSTTSTTSNGVDTFPLFDDFDDSSISAVLWNTVGSPSETGTILSLTDDDIVYSKTQYDFDYAFYSGSKMNEQDGVFIAVTESGNGVTDTNYIHIGSSDITYPDDFDRLQIRATEDGFFYTEQYKDWVDFRSNYLVYYIKQYDANGFTIAQADNSYYWANDRIPNGDRELSFHVWDSSQESELSVDWAFTRKCVEDEPTGSINVEEIYDDDDDDGETRFLWYPIFFYVIGMIFMIAVGITLRGNR